ncbi:MAG: hypothetical protein ABI685_09045 [Ferruginibacter sp.]
MNKLRPLLFAVILFTLFSCEKEYSSENSGAPSELIVGLDCRISKITYTDTSGMAAGGPGTGLGYLSADINSVDIVTQITKYDSLSNTIEFFDIPTYSNDTVFINADEYFIVDATKRISKLHGLVDPTDPFSLQFDVFYVYNAAGYLTTKTYFLTVSPTIPFYQVDYTYAFGNLTHMTGTDLSTGDLIIDADLNYFTNIIPKRYIYLFPDEKAYPYFSQFYNYGLKNFNAIKKMTVRNYDPGNVVRDSLVSNFSNYIMSRDTYVLSVQMSGDDQPSIPASASKLRLSYHCR